MIEDRICAYCDRQNEFILLIIKLHLVQQIGSGIVYHPITNNFLAQVLDYKTTRPINYIIHKINSYLIDEEGLKHVDQLKVLGMVSH